MRSITTAFASGALLLFTSVVSGEKLLIKQGKIVNDDLSFVGDVLVDNGKIIDVGANLATPSDARIINARNKVVFPGGIDPHTHLKMPFMGTVSIDDFATGHRAALAGGTTMHIDFVLPIDGSLRKGYEHWVNNAKDGHMDFAFHAAVTHWSEQVKEDMTYLAQEKGINSFKFFLAYKNSLMINDSDFIQALKHCKHLGAIAQVHAENGEAVEAGQLEQITRGNTGPIGHAMSRPHILEEEATVRALTLAKFVGVPLYVVHVMSKSAMDAVARARNDGQRVVGEPTIAGITLDESLLLNENFDEAAKYVMSPPIRTRAHDGEALRKALRNDILSVLATDHAVFSREQKRRGMNDFRYIPNGVNGLEERVPLAWSELVATGEITPEQFVRITSTNAAKIFGVYPQKGRIAVGSDADIVILDPAKTHKISASTHFSAVDQNVWEGWTLSGKIDVTISRGRVVFEDGKFLLAKDSKSSKYIPTPLFPPFLYSNLEVENKFQENKMIRDGFHTARGQSVKSAYELLNFKATAPSTTCDAYQVTPH